MVVNDNNNNNSDNNNNDNNNNDNNNNDNNNTNNDNDTDNDNDSYDNDNNNNIITMIMIMMIIMIIINDNNNNNNNSNNNYDDDDGDDDWILCVYAFLDTKDEFTLFARGCIPKDFELRSVHNLYVEMTLSGCKYLCQFLHDQTCSMIIFLLDIRSCILLPWHNITVDNNLQECDLVQLHYRRRQQGIR